MQNRTIFRSHFRGQTKTNIDEAAFNAALTACEVHAQQLIAEEKLMTVALYHYENMLFLYFESIEELSAPDDFMAPLAPFIETWPHTDGLRNWAKMFHIYYHAIPEGENDWKRTQKPALRRGRIALLKDPTMFEYVYHHFAIVEEGILQGDKYQSIALHEDILFSYFEEPKTTINIKRDLSLESETIKEWIKVDPEDHFIPYKEANNANFLLLPAHFSIGQE